MLEYVHKDEQLTDFLNKVVIKRQLSNALSKLGIIDIYAPA